MKQYEIIKTRWIEDFKTRLNDMTRAEWNLTSIQVLNDELLAVMERETPDDRGQPTAVRDDA